MEGGTPLFLCIPTRQGFHDAFDSIRASFFPSLLFFEIDARFPSNLLLKWKIIGKSISAIGIKERVFW